MSNKVKIVCKSTLQHGKQVRLPDVGKVQLSEDGEVEVPEETAKLLVNKTTDWRYAEGHEPESEEEETEEETDENVSNETGGKLSEEELDKTLKQALIKKYTGANAEKELKELAQNSGVQKTVIGKAKGKLEIINMILNKLSIDEKSELAAAL